MVTDVTYPGRVYAREGTGDIATWAGGHGWDGSPADHAATIVEVAPGNTLQQSIQPRPLGATRGTVDAFVAVDRHDQPAKPSSGLLQGRKLVLDRLPAITGADTDIQGGASGRCCHAVNIARIGHPSIAKFVGQGFHKSFDKLRISGIIPLQF
jgi:hypothetical protein